MPLRPCLDCGTPASSTRCPPCTRTRDHLRGTSTHRGYGSQWRRLSQQIIERDGGICCLRTHCQGAPATTTDHLTPKVRGGTDDPSNLVAACRRCNSAKRDRDVGDRA